MPTETEALSLEDRIRFLEARLNDMEHRQDEMEVGRYLTTRRRMIHRVIRRVEESFCLPASLTATPRRDKNTVEARVVAAWILMQDYGVARGDLRYLFDKDWSSIQHLVHETMPSILGDRTALKRAQAIRDRILEEIPPC